MGQEYDELIEMLKQEELDKVKQKRIWKKNLNGLINVSGLFKFLNEEAWTPLGIVEIYETDEKTGGYRSYQHVRIKDDPKKLLYMKQNSDDIRGCDHYCVWQTCGVMDDDYSGYLLFPLKNGLYFHVSYSM